MFILRALDFIKLEKSIQFPNYTLFIAFIYQLSKEYDLKFLFI